MVATAIALTGLSNAGEVITGHNVIRDDCLGGNQQTYDGVQIALSMFAAGVIFLGDLGRSMGSVSATKDGPGAMTYRPNLRYVKESYLEKCGIDPHSMKRDVLGYNANLSHYDTYVDKNTSQLYLIPKNQTGEPIQTDYFLPNR